MAQTARMMRESAIQMLDMKKTMIIGKSKRPQSDQNFFYT
jgi:hypothetical protein